MQFPKLRERGRLALTPINVFCLCAGIGALVVFFCLFFSKGELIDNYFWHDTIDTGMDFFHSVEYMHGRVPYERYGVRYPPLANLFFLGIYYLVPRSVSSQWPTTFEDSVYMRKTSLDTRTEQAMLLSFLLVLVVTFVLLAVIFIRLLKKHGDFKAAWATLLLCLCPGMALAVERGNILIVAVLLILVFLCFRNADNVFARAIALLSLVIAGG